MQPAENLIRTTTEVDSGNTIVGAIAVQDSLIQNSSSGLRWQIQGIYNAGTSKLGKACAYA
jgi:hypothetical protein